jgi:hypothetical protein
VRSKAGAVVLCIAVLAITGCGKAKKTTAPPESVIYPIGTWSTSEVEVAVGSNLNWTVSGGQGCIPIGPSSCCLLDINGMHGTVSASNGQWKLQGEVREYVGYWVTRKVSGTWTGDLATLSLCGTNEATCTSHKCWTLTRRP